MNKPPLNREWHMKNKMPEKASDKQRAMWHIEHLKHCNCRKPTPKIQKLIDEFKYKT